MSFKKILLHFNFLAHITFLYFWVNQPKQLFWPVLVLVLSYVVNFFTLYRHKRAGKSIGKLTPDIWLILSELLVLLFIEITYLKYIIIFFVALVVLVYQRNLFFSIFEPYRFKSNLFSFLKDFIIYVASFFWLTAVFAFKIFININFWWSFLLIFLISFLAVFFLLRNSGAKVAEHKILIFIYPLVGLELFSILDWFPFNFYIKALIMISFYHAFSGLGKLFLKKKIDQKSIWRYIIIFVIIWLATFATARWY